MQWTESGLCHRPAVHWAQARPEGLDEFAEAGVDRAPLRVPTGGRDVVLPAPVALPDLIARLTL